MWFNSKSLLREFLRELTFERSSFWNANSWPVGKDPDARKDWGQEEKGVTEDEMVGWHHYSMDMSSSKLQEIVKDRSAWCPVVHGVSKSQARLSDWKTSFKKNPKKPNRT